MVKCYVGNYFVEQSLMENKFKMTGVQKLSFKNNI